MKAPLQNRRCTSRGQRRATFVQRALHFVRRAGPLSRLSRVGFCHPIDGSPPGFQCMTVKTESEVAQSCPTLSDPMDCSLPGSSVHGIFQARILEWGAIAGHLTTKPALGLYRLRTLFSFLPSSCCLGGHPGIYKERRVLPNGFKSEFPNIRPGFQGKQGAK